MRIQSTPCKLAYKYVKGRKVEDKRHVCRPSCSWSADRLSQWCNETPYPSQEYPPVQVYTPPCEYGKPEKDHWRNQSINGYAGKERRIPCEGNKDTGVGFNGRCNAMPRRHLPTCDCLQCVSDRITADKRERVA